MPLVVAPVPHIEAHYGVFTTEPIPKGTLLCEYRGLVIEETEYFEFMMEATEVFPQAGTGSDPQSIFHYDLDFWSECLRDSSDSEPDSGAEGAEGEERPGYIADLCNFLAHQRFVVSGRFVGSLARYINHSCAPNAEAQRWLTSAGQIAIIIVARGDLGEGEELTMDYGWNRVEKDMVCHCGSSNCRGFL